jgi:hypothetical protein
MQPAHLVVEAPVSDAMLDEVDDKDSDNFANFNNEEDAPGVTDEQQVLLAFFETACRDHVGR